MFWIERATAVSGSAAGGRTSKKSPPKLREDFKETIAPAVGFRRFRRASWRCSPTAGRVGVASSEIMQSLYVAYEAVDASLVEINPFLLTKDNRLIALDAKVNFDDNALFRHPEFRDLTRWDEPWWSTKKHGRGYRPFR